MCSLSIVLADNHPIVREGLKTVVCRQDGWYMAAETGNAAETIDAIRTLNPDLLILDLMMLQPGGMEVISELKNSSSSTKIMMFSAAAAEFCVSECIKRGAQGYVSKDSTPGEILEAIGTIVSGQTYLDKRLHCLPAASFAVSAGNLRKQRFALTQREHQVLAHISEGKSNKEIASGLDISVRTVEAHRTKIMRKLRIDSHAGLIRYAMSTHLHVCPDMRNCPHFFRPESLTA